MSNAQPFLEHNLPAAGFGYSTAMQHDHRFLPITIHDEDSPDFAAFGQLLDEHIQHQLDMSDHFTAQLAGPQIQPNHEFVTRLADRLHARINATINASINSRRTQDLQGPTLGHTAHSPRTFATDSLWLGPLSPAQEQVAISEIVQDVHMQEHIGPIDFWPPLEPSAPVTSAPGTEDRILVPDLDSLFSREGPLPVILA